MKPEARVGLVVLLALLLLGSLAFFLGRVPFLERGYELTVIFETAEGLAPGTPVRLAGVPVGEVRALRLTPDHRAAVRVRIRPEVRIPVGSRFQVLSSTLLGNRYLAILPSDRTDVLPPGAVVVGERAVTVEDLYRRIDALAQDLQAAVRDVRGLARSAGEVVRGLEETVRSVQRTLAHPRLQASLLRAAEHLEDAARSVDRTARSIEVTAQAVGREVTRTARALQIFAEDLRTSAAEVRALTEEVTARGETAGRIRRTVASVEETAATLRRTASVVEQTIRRIEQMSRDLQEGLLNPEQIREVRGLVADARRTARRVDEVMERIDRGMGSLGPVLQRVQEGVLLLPHLQLTYELWYDSRTQFRQDLDLWVMRDQPRSYRLGIHDVGRQNLLQLQAGFRLTDHLGWRVGLVDSQIGVGLDYRPGPAWRVSLDLTDVNRPTLNLSLHYAVQPHLSVGLHLRGLLQEPSYGFGLQYRF